MFFDINKELFIVNDYFIIYIYIVDELYIYSRRIISLFIILFIICIKTNKMKIEINIKKNNKGQ